MTWMTILLVLCVFACGYFLNSSSESIRIIGAILALVGLIFCGYIGYKLGGIVGLIIGIVIMLSVIGTGLNKSDEMGANEYLANKNKERKEQQ